MKKKFTIELTYDLPMFMHVNVEADSIEEACEQALQADDWSNAKEDWNGCGETFVTGVWEGEDAEYVGAAIAVPVRFGRPAVLLEFDIKGRPQDAD